MASKRKDLIQRWTLQRLRQRRLPQVIVWVEEQSYKDYKGREPFWTIGYFIGGHLNQWRIAGSNYDHTPSVKYWMEITKPKTKRGKK